MPVVVALLVVLEDGVVDAVVRAHLEPDEDDVRDEQQHGNDSGYLRRSQAEVYL